jgi:ankyrin repeat protein
VLAAGPVAGVAPATEPRRRGAIGATPFLLAAKAVNVPIMQALLAGHADVTTRTESGMTPLMVAAGLMQIVAPPARRKDFSLYNSNWNETDGLEAVTLLTRLGADINAVNAVGQTALHGAAYQGADHIVQCLVDAGAKLNVQDAEGRTPFRVAEGHLESGLSIEERPQTAALLRQLGADSTLGVDAYTLLRERQRNAARQATGSNRQQQD